MVSVALMVALQQEAAAPAPLFQPKEVEFIRTAMTEFKSELSTYLTNLEKDIKESEDPDMAAKVMADAKREVEEWVKQLDQIGKLTLRDRMYNPLLGMNDRTWYHRNFVIVVALDSYKADAGEDDPDRKMAAELAKRVTTVYDEMVARHYGETLPTEWNLPDRLGEPSTGG